jgi:N-acetylmuramoyl-L-alanine amidase
MLWEMWGNKLRRIIQKRNRIWSYVLFSLFCPVCLWLADGMQAHADEPVVVVIDPGHGGDNLGAEYEDYTEKDMTMIVADAMKEELEKYDGIQVYMTRDGDIAKDMSLEERSAYAESVNADFMFCLHFNMSAEHTLFGSECWVSAFGEEYSKGYSFASVEMELLQDMGLYSRGIKTRLNSKGTDYYGIIRTATQRGIPCVLIEHCHLDQENDQPFYDHNEKLKEFGKLDATAVAKYFNLRSDELGADYSDYQNVQVPVPASVVKPDSTEPDVCMIDVVDQNMNTGEVTVQISAMDYDSGMLYYDYSYDNGVTFSDRQRWGDKEDDTITFTMQVPPNVVPQIVVNAYNGYDLYTTSNMVSLPSMDYKTEEEQAEELAGQEAVESAAMQEESSKPVKDITYETVPQSEEEKQPASLGYFLAVCGVCALLVLGMVFSVMLIYSSSAKKRRRRRSYHSWDSTWKDER